MKLFDIKRGMRITYKGPPDVRLSADTPYEVLKLGRALYYIIDKLEDKYPLTNMNLQFFEPTPGGQSNG